jgi:uncharacterized protein
MALINHATRKISAKIVNYGREGVGKRASLLAFDFSPFEHPVFGGYRIRFHMYSLTGAVTNPAAWDDVLPVSGSQLPGT